MTSPPDVPLPDLPAPEPGGRSEKSSGLTSFFVGPDGVRAGWRLLLYLVLAFAGGYALGGLILAFWRPPAGQATPTALLFQELVGFSAALLAALLMSLIEKRPVGVYGLPLREAFGKLFWQGFAWGLAEISALILLIAAWGGYSFGTLAVRGRALAAWALFWVFLFVFVGLFEEFLFRGYTQFTLGKGIGFWPAAALLSLAFGAVHLRNKGENPVGAVSVALIGIFFCLTLRRTGSLWFAVGMHASFDFGETFLYSVPNSGLVVGGHLFHATLHGPAWLTGGSVGPEGSVFSFLILALLFVLFPRVYKARTAANPAP